MYERSVLGNQLRVLTSTMDHTRSVSIVICVGAGSRYEPPEQAGRALCVRITSGTLSVFKFSWSSLNAVLNILVIAFVISFEII